MLGLILCVDVEEGRVFRIAFRFCSCWPLLVLRYSEAHRCCAAGSRFDITGGILTAPGGRAWLEFRDVLGGRHVLVALHDYRPRLRWYIYLFTQAQLHLWIMHSVARSLRPTPP